MSLPPPPADPQNPLAGPNTPLTSWQAGRWCGLPGGKPVVERHWRRIAQRRGIQPIPGVTHPLLYRRVDVAPVAMDLLGVEPEPIERRLEVVR